MCIRDREATEEHRKYYQGLPVTSVSLILPCIYILSVYFQFLPLDWTYNIAMIIVSFLFVLDFRVKKPGNVGVIIMTIAGLAVLAGVLIFCD